MLEFSMETRTSGVMRDHTAPRSAALLIQANEHFRPAEMSADVPEKLRKIVNAYARIAYMAMWTARIIAAISAAC